MVDDAIMQTSSNIDAAIAKGCCEVVEGGGQQGQVLTLQGARLVEGQQNSKILTLMSIGSTSKANNALRGCDAGSIGKAAGQGTDTLPIMTGVIV